MIYGEYNSDGRFLRSWSKMKARVDSGVLTFPNPDVTVEVGEGVDIGDYYFDGQSVRKRPLPSFAFDKLVTVADGESPITLINAPESGTFRFENPQMGGFEGKFTNDEGAVEFVFDVPSVYTFEIESFPIRVYRGSINVVS